MIEFGNPLYTWHASVRWGDMDALSHVNNTVYFRYFEQTRVEWWASLGYPPFGEEGNRHGMVIVDASAEFVLPLLYPAQFTVRMGGHSPGRSSFLSTYCLEVGETVYTRGSARIVWIDRVSGKSAPLPEAIRAMLLK